jgi:hypothetical protein
VKVVGFFGHSGELSSELKRACRVLALSCEIASSERGVIRIVEAAVTTVTSAAAAPTAKIVRTPPLRDCGDTPGSVTVVITEDQIGLLRELRARAPEIRILLLSRRPYSELPYFMAINPSIDCYFFSHNLKCSADFFVNFLLRQLAARPDSVTGLLANYTSSIKFSLTDVRKKQELLDGAHKYYLWCCGDSDDPGELDRVRHLQDSLDELVSNVLQHGLRRGARIVLEHDRGRAESQPEILAEVELSFDGSRIVTCVRDPFGLLDKATVLKSLATDHKALQRAFGADLPSGGLGLKMVMENHQHLIFNLCADDFTEIVGVAFVTSRFIDADALPTSLEVRTLKKSG